MINNTGKIVIQVWVTFSLSLKKFYYIKYLLPVLGIFLLAAFPVDHLFSSSVYLSPTQSLKNPQNGESVS